MKKTKKDFGNRWVTFGVVGVFLFPLVSYLVFPNQVERTLSIVEKAGAQFASMIISHNFRSADEIKSRYTGSVVDQSNKKVRILIVPGHEPTFGGAEYTHLKEREMALELGQNLKSFLDQDPRYEVFITRDSNGWTPNFATYFTDNWDNIVEWTKASKVDFARLVSVGAVTQIKSTVIPNDVPKSVAYRLYGITKWANENLIDITIHIHFNDNPRRNVRKSGEYSGFSIYVPASQYGNSTSTKVVADTIFKRLSKYTPVSNLAGESSGIIDGPELIAIGSHNTADSASLLIEYSYIYEPQFQDREVRSLVIQDLAFQTYLGVHDFFDPENRYTSSGPYDTSLLPYKWDISFAGTEPTASGIFALQTALIFDDVYPPPGKSKSDCPRTSGFGPCTRTALEFFQNKHGIIGEKGVMGKKTIEVLNRL